MSWRREERGSRWGAPEGRDRRDREREPLWEMRRSASSERGSPRDRYRDRERDRDRREDRHRGRERYDRERRDRDRDRRRDSRLDVDDDVPAPPSPPTISENETREGCPKPEEYGRHAERPDWNTEESKIENDSINASPGDWFCKCGLYNFKRRQMCYRRNCNGSRAEGIVYGGDEGSGMAENAGITKRLLFRRLDALTTEERILEEIKDRCTKSILDSIAGITIGRETLTGASKCIAYINFNSIADSTAAHTELSNLNPPFEVDGREVLIGFYNEPKKQQKTTQDYAAYTAYQLAQSPYANPQQALSEADRVNAAAAVAASAISAAQARSTPWTPANAPTFNSSNTLSSTATNIPTGDGTTTYTSPDVRTFMYDDISGYYYDPSTGLYYDGKTQYFFNSQLNKYMYWDGTNNTYIAASQTQQKPDAVQPPTPIETVPYEEKKKKDKEDKVKVAKKIAKDMERWARTLNQKKENAKSNIVAEQVLDTAASKGSIDIGFSVLSAGPSQPVLVRDISPPPIPDEFLIKKVIEPPTENDDGIIDWVKLTCLLCKRKFPSIEVLTKHKTLSDLHKQNLAEFRKKNDLLPQSNGYRDRAAERRMKFGEDEIVPVLNNRKRYEPPEPQVMSHPPPSVVDTIGGKMLQKMGWSEGKGLGKTNQGRIAPIEAEQRPGLAGLGQKRGIYTPTPGETYRDTVKKLMIARYKEVVADDDDK